MKEGMINQAIIMEGVVGIITEEKDAEVVVEATTKLASPVVNLAILVLNVTARNNLLSSPIPSS
jgi:hypothetical protein